MITSISRTECIGFCRHKSWSQIGVQKTLQRVLWDMTSRQIRRWQLTRGEKPECHSQYSDHVYGVCVVLKLKNTSAFGSTWKPYKGSTQGRNDTVACPVLTGLPREWRESPLSHCLNWFLCPLRSLNAVPNSSSPALPHLQVNPNGHTKHGRHPIFTFPVLYVCPATAWCAPEVKTWSHTLRLHVRKWVAGPFLCKVQVHRWFHFSRFWQQPWLRKDPEEQCYCLDVLSPKSSHVWQCKKVQRRTDWVIALT